MTDAEPDVPRCRYFSLTPWGRSQCALPAYHAGHHAFSPSEAIRDRKEPPHA
jgi:hypothetical protein